MDQSSVDEELLAHFESNAALMASFNSWLPADRELFFRLVNSVHEKGLDWFHVDIPGQVRFGRKERGAKRAARRGVAGTVRFHGPNARSHDRGHWTVSLRHGAAGQPKGAQRPTSELIAAIEADLSRFARDHVVNREGLWPSDLNADSRDSDDDIEDAPMHDDDASDFLQSIDVNETPFNVILYGPPGTSKTFAVGNILKQYEDDTQEPRHCFVTFHQSYGYEEFVEGLRPVIREPGESNNAEGFDPRAKSGSVQYEIRPGVFKQLCAKARRAPDKRFLMIIDEINRGNIAKIFGELITLIEIDKREGTKHSVSLTLPYSGEQFSVPANVNIIGTMNTADRSLALLDTALRRRFEFIAMMPDVRDDLSAPLGGLTVKKANAVIEIPSMLRAINERIEALYDRDHTIGHAYFTRLKAIKDEEKRFDALKGIFRRNVMPLLEEYFFEDWQKIQLVLGDSRKPESARFVVGGKLQSADLNRLFGGAHGLDEFSPRHRYEVNQQAFENPEAYLGIYQDLPKSQ